MLRLRPFAETDDAELLTWFNSWSELRTFAGEDITWPLTGEQLSRWRSDPRIRAWSAWCPPDPKSVVGHVQLVDTGPASTRLARVAVAPNSRGEGYGRALVTAALQEAGKLRIEYVTLNVYEDNEPARRLYASLGFEDLGSPKDRPDIKRMGRYLVGDRSRSAQGRQA